MDDGSQNVYVRRLKIILLVSSLASLVLLLLAAFEENLTGEWRTHQTAYRDALLSNAKSEQARQAAERMPVQIQQVFLSELDRIDRCVTCHAAVEDPNQADAELPLRTHPGDFLKTHPVAKFGCTVCHDGQGRATERSAAHGEVKHWPTPLLRGESVYTSCGRCHYENDLFAGEGDLFASHMGGPDRLPLDEAELNASVPGAQSPTDRAIGRGKQLVMASGCLGCHQFRGRGGTLGPDITHVGDKTAHDYDFSHVHGAHTAENWLTEHFKNPGEVVPGTLMPAMGLTDAQAGDLAQYMLSLRRKQMPAAFTPPPPQRNGKEVSGEQLYAMFCNSCHGEKGQGSTIMDPELMALADPPEVLMTPAINNPDTLAVASDDFLHHIITEGRDGTNMIGWRANEGGLANTEIDRLVSYIRGWQKVGVDPHKVGAIKGNARRGRALFRTRCVSCHGRNGEGGIGPSLNSPSFLAVASDDFLASAIVRGRANTAMPAWKQLSEEQVNDLLAHLRTWERKPADKSEVLSRLASNTSPNSRALRIGETIYRANCGACHGNEGGGGIGPSLNTDAFLSIVDDSYLYDAIVLGRPGTAMPAWKHLSAEDIVDVINYMRSWNKRKRRKLEPYLAQGDWEHGRILYTSTCAGCHGNDAEGLIGPQLNNPVFLASASDAMLREWVWFGKPGTPMRAHGKQEQEMVELKKSQVDDIVTYLRRLETHRPAVTSRPGIGIVPHGAIVYQSACAACHGTHGQGATGSALANLDFLRSASDGFLQATIVMGRDNTEMRAMGVGGQGNVELSEEDINNLVAFIRSWERMPPVAPVGEPPRQRFVIGANLHEGRELYVGNCAGCHGLQGGVNDDGWAPSLNNRDFLIAATDGYLQATIARGRESTPMRAFGIGGEGLTDLSSDQINNIVAYIRNWAPDGYKPVIDSPEIAGAAKALAQTRREGQTQTDTNEHQ